MTHGDEFPVCERTFYNYMHEGVMGMTLLELPGHSYDMVGFRTPDGNAYIGDSVSSAETLQKYGIGYLWDVGAYLRTLELLPTLEAKQYIPAHAPVCTEIGPLAQLNQAAVQNTAAQILSLCAEPTAFDELLKRVKRMQYAEKLTDKLTAAYESFEGGEGFEGVVDQLVTAANSLEAAGRIEESFAALAAEVSDLRYRAEDLAERAPKPIVKVRDKKRITPESIMDIVAEKYHIRREDLLSGRRSQDVAMPRQLAIYLTRELTGLSTTRIGSAFDRDHSTIMYACRKTAEQIEQDARFEKSVNDLIQAIRES